jgi:hypothetical protein
MNALLLLIGFSLTTMATAAPPPPPQNIVVIACRVDTRGTDETAMLGVRGTGDQGMTWHFDKGNQLECKREEVALIDSVPLVAPEVPELHPNFADLAQCSAVSLQYAPTYEKAHQGWGVMAIGCPVKVTSGGPDGPVIAWHLPECPMEIGGLTITCKFDNSLI